MRRQVGLLALLLSSCAPAAPVGSPGGTAIQPPAVRPEVNNGVGYEFVLRGEGASSHQLSLAGSMDSAWAALSRAYQTLGIPAVNVDAAAKEIGTPGTTLRARLGHASLATYLDCGRVLGGPIASTYRVTISVGSTLRAGADGAPLLLTRVSATASDPGSSGGAVRCNSTGELEKRIAALTAAGHQ